MLASFLWHHPDQERRTIAGEFQGGGVAPLGVSETPRGELDSPRKGAPGPDGGLSIRKSVRDGTLGVMEPQEGVQSREKKSGNAKAYGGTNGEKYSNGDTNHEAIDM